MHKQRREELHLMIESLIDKLKSSRSSTSTIDIYKQIIRYANELTANVELVTKELSN